MILKVGVYHRLKALILRIFYDDKYMAQGMENLKNNINEKVLRCCKCLKYIQYNTDLP